jgi:hypothetical protein
MRWAEIAKPIIREAFIENRFFCRRNSQGIQVGLFMKMRDKELGDYF